MTDASVRHDPGGKVRLRLKDGVGGTAAFSPCGRYRTLLTRSWEGASLDGHVLWIGMNPSTAAADVDDPTVFKETKYTRRWGYGSYVKCNVMDYRATQPRDLLAEGVEPRSADNLPTILEAARGAALVILAYGALHPRLARYGNETALALATAGHRLHCLALTKAGHPGHPLYLKDSCDPMPYPLDRVIEETLT